MKILFVCHRLPFPPNEGGKIRSFNMIRHLAQRHSVVVASLAYTRDELENGKDLEKHCEDVIAEVLPNPVRWLNASRALPTPSPSSVAFFWSQRLHRRIKERAQHVAFDVVIVHCAFVAQYVSESYSRVRILDYADLDSAKWREYAKHRTRPLSLGYSLEARKLRNYEHRVAAQFNHCTVTTQGERDEFEALLTGVPCSVIPNGVDTAYFTRLQRSGLADPVIVLLGRMDYFPNIDAACHFAESIFPMVRQKIPAAKFLIVGSNPARPVQLLERIEGVSVTGHVADVRQHVKEAAVSVAPLRIARGTQNKILESMAMGIPVVATPQAAKGIQAIAGRHLLVAEQPAQFAERVIEVLTNEMLHRAVADAARGHLDHTHNWPSSMKLLDDLLTEQVRKSSRGTEKAGLADSPTLADTI